MQATTRTGILDAHVDPWSLAGDSRLRRRASGCTGADDDARCFALPRHGELDGVAEKVDENLVHPRLVSPRGETGGVPANGVREFDALRARLRRDERKRVRDRIPNADDVPHDRRLSDFEP